MQLPGRVFVIMIPNNDGSDPDEIDVCCQKERFTSLETWTHIRRLLMFLQTLRCANLRVKLKVNVVC